MPKYTYQSHRIEFQIVKYAYTFLSTRSTGNQKFTSKYLLSRSSMYSVHIQINQYNLYLKFKIHKNILNEVCSTIE